MHHHWLGIAIRLCGPQRKFLAQRIGVSTKTLTYWLNHGKKIPLECAIKIENTTKGRVTRFQLAPYLDQQSKREMQAEYLAAQSIRPPLTFSEKVALGLAIEAELGSRQGARTDCLLREKFPEVEAIWSDFFSSDAVYQGRTEEIAAYYTQLGSYKSYQKAKKIVQLGITELVNAMDHRFPIDRAYKIAQHPSEKQRYLLSLGHKQMIRELEALSNKPIKKERSRLKENNSPTKITKNDSGASTRENPLESNLSPQSPHDASGYWPTLTWALFNLVGVLKPKT